MSDPKRVAADRWPAAAIICFLVLVFLLSFPPTYVVIRAGEVDAFNGFADHAIMWCPAVSALITCAVFRISVSRLGLDFPKVRFMIAGYILPLLVFVAAYAAIGLSGMVPMTLSHFSKFTSDSLHLGRYSGLVGFLLIATIAVIQDCAATIGEEIGWRGLLVPALSQRYSFFVTALISGIIWAVWHYPMIFGMGFGSVGSLGSSTLLFTIDVLLLAFIMTWLRLKSGYIWPTVVYHASNNTFGGRIFEKLPLMPAISERTSKIIAELVVLVIILTFFSSKSRRGVDFEPATGSG